MRPIDYLFSGNIEGFLLSLLYLLPALVIAIAFHEAAHAWMANKMGDPTARNLGRMTLDPTKHFDLFGLISFLLIGFGWGKPVPTNPRNYYNYKKGNVLVALAGVTMNIAIALIVLIALSIMTKTGVLKSLLPLYSGSLSIMAIIHTMLFYIANINLILFFFNLIPIPPLDGHHLVKGFIARKSPRFYMAYNQYGFIFLILILFTTPLGKYLSQLVYMIIQGVASIFGVPFAMLY